MYKFHFWGRICSYLFAGEFDGQFDGSKKSGTFVCRMVNVQFNIDLCDGALSR